MQKDINLLNRYHTALNALIEIEGDDDQVTPFINHLRERIFKLTGSIKSKNIYTHEYKQVVIEIIDKYLSFMDTYLSEQEAMEVLTKFRVDFENSLLYHFEDYAVCLFRDFNRAFTFFEANSQKDNRYFVSIKKFRSLLDLYDLERAGTEHAKYIRNEWLPRYRQETK